MISLTARYTPAQLLYKVPRVVRRRLRARWRRWRDAQVSTYAGVFPQGTLARYLPDVSARIEGADLAALAGVTAQYRHGWFDLLGSGWVPVHHGQSFAGVEGHQYGPYPPVEPDPDGRWLHGRVTPANRAEAQRRWRLIEGHHVPIDWQVDFRSGYRWDERTPAQQMVYGHLPGVDVKVPWELARMYHLPQLALAFGAARHGREGLAPPEDYQRAFRNQVLDFLATNPPRFGINWNTAMLAGIRAANMAVAFDLFRAAGARFDPDFEQVLARSLYEHGRFILDHLEWWDFDERNNHYLANLVGLLFVAAYLPPTPETDTWLAFAWRELCREVVYQVNEEGSGFEASTCYHAFSAEMLAWAAALILALPAARRVARPQAQWLPREAARRAFDGVDPGMTALPPAYTARLHGMYDFLQQVTRPDHQLVQIGDNDSGRFIKLLPVYHCRTVAEACARYAHLSVYTALPDTARYWEEDLLDYRPTQALLQALVTPEVGGGRLETWLLREWIGVCPVKPAPVAPPVFTAPETLAAWRERVAALPEDRKSRLEIPALPGDLREGLQARCYPAFGLWLFRSSRLWLGVRCGPAQLQGRVGHPHEDQLALECWLDGVPLIVDPGTYTYTALLERRNWYRSEAAHFVPRCAGEAANMAPEHAAFALHAWHPAACRAFEATGFVGVWARPAGGEIGRMVEITATAVCITDFSLAACPPGDLHAAWAAQATLPVSVGYGRVLNRQGREG